MRYALSVCLIAAGCSPIVWQKPSGTLTEFKRDNYACERDARQSGYFGGGIMGAVAMQDFYKRCMESKGYVARE